MLDLLQVAGDYYSYGAQAGTMGISQGGSLILMGVIGVLGWIVQARLQSVFAKYSKVPFPGMLTGAEVAAKMLRDNNVHNVKITHVGGQLTDHFNPATMTVNLSDSVYSSRSIAAAAVACHECGHAIQHAQGYAPLVMRSALVPVVNFSSRIATWVIIAGIAMMASGMGTMVCWIGIGLIAMSALFSIVTLPVEYNASARALAWLESSRTLQGVEVQQAKESLRWAARTYLVAALSAIATVLYYVAMISRRND
ncbi:MAG: zinc metallopeptidase [Alistipes sp.]|nr:zinc metallopeptidase [Alistipes sp.]